ncbi:hypothetical protein FRC07_001796 [Ceratobasidium sp. 392]|nr:hypothetical protein FRC07_001796 [Ceratobasidium sp. 392]
MPLVTSISASSRARHHKTIPIVFPFGWEGRRGSIFDWYRGLPCQYFHRLQIRKDSTGPVPHRFIVAHLTDGSRQRFDRRPKSKNSGEILAAGFFKTSVIEAADEAEAVESSAWPELEKDTQCEVDLDLEDGMDILAILSACYGISCDESAQNYALLQYNCYFFSWTILAIVARHKAPTGIQRADQIFGRLEPRLSSLAATLSGELSHAFIQGLLDNFTAIRREAGTWAIYKGSVGIAKIFWLTPTVIFRFHVRTMLVLGLHPALRPYIERQLLSGLFPKLRLTLESQLHAHLIHANVHNFLWFADIQGIIEHATQAEISNNIWGALLGTIGEAVSDGDVTQAADNVGQAFFVNHYPSVEAQFNTLNRAALQATLCAIHKFGREMVPDDTTTREHIFEEASRVACDAALEAARAVVRDTGPQLNNPKRDVMWEKIWEAWPLGWRESMVRLRKSLFLSVDTLENSLVDGAVQAAAWEIGSSHLKLAPVRVNINDQAAPLHASNAQMTHIELQEFLRKLIRASTREQDSPAIMEAMDRVWKTSQQVLDVTSEA